jgi:hypothetical protein
MKKGSTLFLKGVVVMIGVGVFALCVFVLPRIIGTFDMGGYDPILLGMYVPAIPFFVALCQALLILNNIDKNNPFSDSSVKAFKYIKYSALSICGLYAAGLPYIFHAAQGDDAPGVVAIALIIIFASFVIATFAAVLQKLLQNVLDIKSENELTV